LLVNKGFHALVHESRGLIFKKGLSPALNTLQARVFDEIVLKDNIKISLKT